jgi:hypothetical protein
MTQSGPHGDHQGKEKVGGLYKVILLLAVSALYEFMGRKFSSHFSHSPYFSVLFPAVSFGHTVQIPGCTILLKIFKSL